MGLNNFPTDGSVEVALDSEFLAAILKDFQPMPVEAVIKQEDGSTLHGQVMAVYLEGDRLHLDIGGETYRTEAVAIHRK